MLSCLIVRTTLTIDDDLAGVLQRKARALGKPFRELVNDTLRKGLSETLAKKGKAIKVRPHDFGATRPGVNMDKLNQLSDELLVEEYLRKAAKDDSSGR
jgi:hypothetical protein